MSKNLTEELKTNIKKELSIFKDNSFLFIEESHKYHYNDIELKPVTTFLKTFIPEFNETLILPLSARKNNTTPELLKAKWDLKRDKSNNIGTYFHLFIEMFYNNNENYLLTMSEFYNYENKYYVNKLKEYDNVNEFNYRVSQFYSLYHSKLKNLYFVASETKIFDIELKIAGTIDALFINPINNELYILDWKSNSTEFTTIEPDKYNPNFINLSSNDKLKLTNTTLNKYSLQTSLYSLILKRNTNLIVTNAFIVHVPPMPNLCGIHKCLDYKEELNNYFESNK